jgi:hypothetical protein
MIGEENSSDKNDIRTGKSGYLGLKIFTGIIISILLTSAIYISAVKHGHQEKLIQVNQTYNKLRNRNKDIEKIKLQRVKFFREQELMVFPAKFSFQAANFIRKLSLIAPEAVSFKELHLDLKNRNLVFCLKGLIAGVSVNDKERVFESFYREFGSFYDLMQVSFSKQFSDKVSSDYSGFTISGELEIE